MQHRADVSVVGIVARAEADVEERRVLRVERVRREQYMRSTGAADSGDIVARPIAPRQASAERRDAQKVEQEKAEFAADVVRQRLGIKVRSKVRECARRMMLFSLHLSKYSRETPSSSCPALCRASTSCFDVQARRGWPGHDSGNASIIFRATLTVHLSGGRAACRIWRSRFPSRIGKNPACSSRCRSRRAAECP